ncbi:MAG: hypothetical protein AB7O04_12625 [Hyphomonadaceae bacterium]
MRIATLLCGLAVILPAAMAGCAGRGGEAGPPAIYFLSPSGEPFRISEAGVPGLDLWFDAADADDDARLTADEFRADARRFFAEVDADQNGLATSPEISTLREARAQQLETVMAARGNPDPSLNRQGPLWTPQTGFVDRRRRGDAGPRRVLVQFLLNEREPVLASDSDFNRRVTMDEFIAATDDRFRLLDINADGALTVSELRENLSR